MPGGEGRIPGGRTRATTSSSTRPPQPSPAAALVSSAVLLAALVACDNERPRGGMCSVELLEVTWPVTIERDGAVSHERLTTTVTPTNVTPQTFDSITATLVDGRAVAPAVTWSVPAFNTDPGGIAVAHPGALTPGAALRVAGVLDGGGWAVMPEVRADSSLVGIEAGEFVAQSASGTLTVMAVEPLLLRVDVTAADSSGATIRVTGDARFGTRRARQRCESLARRGRRDIFSWRGRHPDAIAATVSAENDQGLSSQVGRRSFNPLSVRRTMFVPSGRIV